MKTQFTIEKIFPVVKEEIYYSWLDSQKHSEMTGGEAQCSAIEGESFSAWDGYILGSNVELVPNEKIVQNWRTTEFSESDNDSLLEIKLEPMGNQTKLILTHSEIPEGQSDYKQGWEEHYFNPMSEYFRS